jgi:hypothetical protein
MPDSAQVQFSSSTNTRRKISTACGVIRSLRERFMILLFVGIWHPSYSAARPADWLGRFKIDAKPLQCSRHE